jgi:hypothetical protein
MTFLREEREKMRTTPSAARTDFQSALEGSGGGGGVVAAGHPHAAPAVAGMHAGGAGTPTTPDGVALGMAPGALVAGAPAPPDSNGGPY